MGLPTNSKKPQEAAEIFTGLTKAQQMALSLWFTPNTQKQIAELVGVDETTLSKWKQEPRFRQALDRITEENRLRASDILREGATDASYALTTLARRHDRQACVDVLKAGGVYVERSEMAIKAVHAEIEASKADIADILTTRITDETIRTMSADQILALIAEDFERLGGRG